jgi:hypothetical protein
MLGISDDPSSYKNKAAKNKRKRTGVHFNEEEIVINPEDIDPSIGRFRNLIQTTVIQVSDTISIFKHLIVYQRILGSSLYAIRPEEI